jgi:hypothetical protein
MNIITSKPIVYLNAEGETETKEKKQVNPDLIKAASDILTGVGTSLASKTRQFTEVEQRCGKRPIGKGARAQWQKCVDSGAGAPAPFQMPAPEPSMPAPNTKKPMSKGLKIGLIAGGVVVLGVIGFVIYKSTKK